MSASNLISWHFPLSLAIVLLCHLPGSSYRDWLISAWVGVGWSVGVGILLAQHLEWWVPWPCWPVMFYLTHTLAGSVVLVKHCRQLIDPKEATSFHELLGFLWVTVYFLFIFTLLTLFTLFTSGHYCPLNGKWQLGHRGSSWGIGAFLHRLLDQGPEGGVRYRVQILST